MCRDRASIWGHYKAICETTLHWSEGLYEQDPTWLWLIVLYTIGSVPFPHNRGSSDRIPQNQKRWWACWCCFSRKFWKCCCCTNCNCLLKSELENNSEFNIVWKHYLLHSQFLPGKLIQINEHTVTSMYICADEPCVMCIFSSIYFLVQTHSVSNWKICIFVSLDLISSASVTDV